MVTDMNVYDQRLLAVADQIRSEPSRFDMQWFESERECGTAHCIGGWAKVMFPSGAETRINHHDQAVNALGLTEEHARILFYHCTLWAQRGADWLGAITADMAISVLEDIAHHRIDLDDYSADA